MQDNGRIRINAAPNSSNVSPKKNLEEKMSQLKMEDGEEEPNGTLHPYPNRPGEPNCHFFLRTGICGYGSNCRYNHPTNTGQETQCAGELPQREGQPDCQFFLKTGTCKFGLTCKYHHPRDKQGAQPFQLNFLGLPMRKDEKSCPYYMRTGSCKFGVSCKFNHPQPNNSGAMFPVPGASSYGYAGSSMVPPSGLPFSGLPTWSRIPYMSSPQMQDFPAYMPYLFPTTQGTIPMQQTWSTYMGDISHIPSADVLGPNQISSTMNLLQSGSSNLSKLPERPDQPKCQYYLQTGSCKYGTSCKYHHPKERNQVAMSTIGTHGLPIRPGQPVCTFYNMYGSCNYGPDCKFDHPFVGYYNYSLPQLLIPDPSAQSTSQVMLASSEIFQSKTARLPELPVKSEASNGLQDMDNTEHGSSTESSPSHVAPHMYSPENHSD
ncbi:zinc finger CCCH domain-containing protein 33-like isoform X1 [Typha angustifolia]|uniref:zinc finger CCCH domain-containing protein 33-like isoform X1 n=1 Tax=Typha angustifolia TaxID=59011 RepID=UPI003C2EC0EE